MGDTANVIPFGRGLAAVADSSHRNLFDDIDPAMSTPSDTTAAPNMFSDLPDVMPAQSSALGALTAHAARSAIPMVGGMAGAGAGAEAGGAIGAGIGAFAGPPGAALGLTIGGFTGGLLGFWGGSTATEAAQDWAIHQAPDSWQDALGQSDRAQRVQEEQHPYASYMGGIAPYLLTMAPSGLAKAATTLPENATTFQRVMANPITQKLFSGAMMGGMELGQEKVEGQPVDWAKVGIATGFGLVFSHPRQFGEYLSGLGARPIGAVAEPLNEWANRIAMFRSTGVVPPDGVLNPDEPTVAQGADRGVVGPGITEATYQGGQDQSIASRTTAQNAASDEQTILGPVPTPDLDAIARRLDPQTFARNDELLIQRDALRSWIADESNPPDSAFDELASKRAEVEAALRYANPNSPGAKSFRAQITDIDAQIADLAARRHAWETGTHTDTPDIMLARQHLQDTEHALWDLGPAISSARRRAADHVGEATPAAATEPVPEAMAENAPTPEKGAQKSPEEQWDFIYRDKAAQLLAAGLSRPVAEASAAVEAAYYQTLAARFDGALGTAEELYRARAARVAVPGTAAAPEGAPVQPITRREPAPVRIRTIAEIQTQDGVSATRARRIQEAEILAKGRVIAPGTPRREPTVAPVIPTVQPAEPTAAVPQEAAEARPEPELAEAAQVTPPAPEPRPRLRSAADIMREDRVPESRVKAIQEQELAALADWQARHPATEPRPRRNRATAALAESMGIPAAGVPEPEVVAEIVDRLPPERVVEEVNAEAEAGEIEYDEAEKAAAEVAPEVTETPDQFYGADQSRPLEELESEHRPPNEAAAPEQREGGGGEPIASLVSEGEVPAGGGPAGPVGGPGERPGGEAGEGGAVEHAVAAAGAEPAYQPEPERATEPVGVASLLPTPEAPNVPAHTQGNGGLESLDPRAINVDAERFQFKPADERGVSERLQDIEKWDPRLAGTVLVWRDAAGKLWIADGHQRLALAQRLLEKQPDIRLNAFVLDAKDGVTDRQARVIAAAKNIAEGTGSAVDAAKVLRDAEASGIDVPPLPPRSALVREGRALARLSPDAFGMVVNDIVPPAQGAIVGRLVIDPAQQAEAMRVLAKATPDNLRQAELIVRDVMETATEATMQGGLFGEEYYTQSATLERAKIADEAMRQLTRDRTTFRTLVGEAARIEGHGANVLDTEANRTRLTGDEQARQLLTQLATRKGPVSDALTGIARRVRDGELSAATGAREFLGVVRGRISGGLGERPDLGGAVAGATEERELAAADAQDTKAAETLTDLLGRPIREQPSRHAPEPTIRSDERQIGIPGTEPSAVQAQAARDQAGRGGLLPPAEQKPPNEGLFAPPPEEPKGELFQRPIQSWDELLARGRQVRARAQTYAEAGLPAAFADDAGFKYLVSKDLNYPPDGWRVTMFNRDGEPVGHWETKSAYEAFREVLAKPVEPVGANHPTGELYQHAVSPQTETAAKNKAPGESQPVGGELEQRAIRAKPETIQGQWPNGQHYEVIVNPSGQQLLRMLNRSQDRRVRISATRNGDVVAGDASTMIHNDLGMALRNAAHPMWNQERRWAQLLSIGLSNTQDRNHPFALGDRFVGVTDNHGNHIPADDLPSGVRDALGMPPTLTQRLRQTVQGKIRIAPGEVRSVITLARAADASTFMHETAHDWLKQLLMDAAHALAPDQLRADAATVRRWLKRPDGWTGFKPDGSPDVAPQERFARGFEQYLREGHAPSRALAGVFAQFKLWLTTIYRTLRGLGAPISDDIRQVFDRMLAIEPERITHGEAPERQPSIADIHAADAAETEPREADAVADRIAAERARNQPPPEIAHEIAAAAPVAEPTEPIGKPTGEPGTTTQPGGEATGGTGGRGPLAPGGGQPEPVAPSGGVGVGSGAVGTGRGEAAPKGAAVGAATGEPSAAGRRRSPGSSTGGAVGELAPQPADTFPPSAPTAAVDLAGNIRVENLTPENFREAIFDSAERNDEFRNLRPTLTKGQIFDFREAASVDPNLSDDELQRNLASMFGGMEGLARKVAALRQAIVQSAEIVWNAMGKYTGPDGTDADLHALATAIARHDMLQASLAGATHNWGQTGTAFHSIADGWDRASNLNQLLRDNLGRDLNQLKIIAKLGSRYDSPAKISKLLREGKKRSFGGMLLEYWINGLISGFATHSTYTIGNAILAAEKAGPETAAAAAIGAFRERMGRRGERVHIGEVGAQFRGAIRELPTAIRATTGAYETGLTTQLPGERGRPLLPFQGDSEMAVGRTLTNAQVTWHEAVGDVYGLLQGIRDGITATAAMVRAGGIEGAPMWGWQSSPLGQIPGLAYRGVEVAPLGHIARFPSRNVAAIHSAFRSINYSMEINALAYRRALMEGATGETLAARTAFWRQNPTEEMMQQAIGKATDLTLMGQSSGWVQKLAALFNHQFNVPGLGPTALLKFVDPFVHIAANIMDQSLVKRTPLGVLSSEIRADLSGRNGNVAQDTAMAKMLVGTVMSLMFGGLAAQGVLSGSGPADPRKAAAWRLLGNQPYSVRIGDMWYGMHRLGVMGMLAGVSADLYDIGDQISAQDAGAAGTTLMHAFTQNILDESFMRGPADFIRAITESDRYGPAYVRTQLASFLPYSVLMGQVARATDPYSRQARTIVDAIKARVPGMSEALLPRRDIWGEPVPSGEALLAPGVTAIYEQRATTDPVNVALWNLNVYPGPVERQIRNVRLTDQEYDDYQRIAGRAAKMRLDVFVRSPQYQEMTRASQYEWVEETLRQARESARGLMMMKYPHIPSDAAKERVERFTGASVR